MRRILILLALASLLFAGPEEARKKLKDGIKARDVAVLREAVAADKDRVAFKGALRPLDYVALSRFVKDSEAARKIVGRATTPVIHNVALPRDTKWTPASIERIARKYGTPPVFALAAALQSSDAKLRAGCAARLADLKDDRARPALAAALKTEKDRAARTAMLRTFGRRRPGEPGPLYLQLAQRIFAGEYPAKQASVLFRWNADRLAAFGVRPHHYEAALALDAAQSALKWDTDAKSLIARIRAAQDLASKAVAGGQVATSQAPRVATLGATVLAQALREASGPEIKAWLCDATALVRRGPMDPAMPELVKALGAKDPLLRSAADGALRTLAETGRLDDVKLDERSVRALGSMRDSEIAMRVLEITGHADSQVPMSGSSGEIKPREPTLVTVFYGTDRAEFRLTTGWYVWQFWLAALLALLWPIAQPALRWMLSDRLAVLAKIAKWGCLAGAVLLTVLATYDCIRMYQKHERLGFEYGPERGPFDSDEGPYCHLGTVTVGIPPDHELGEIERPGILTGSPWEDPQEHVVMLTIDPLEGSEFFAKLTQHGRKQAFVFVHGFNVTFENAALRTAQIAHDLDFEGAPMFFSWPSRGEILQYTRDESTVAWATKHLKLFLRDVRRALPDATIHLVAHSMGNRALTEALRRLARDIEDEGLKKFQEVVLAAPDIDAATFRDDIGPAIRGTADRVTLYAAKYDQALEVSKQVHGYPRAGDSNAIVVVDGIESVDVVAEDASLLGHSYYGDVGQVIDDLVKLILYRQGPDVRGLVFDDEAGHWVLK